MYNYYTKKEKKRVFLSFASEDLDHVRGLRFLKTILILTLNFMTNLLENRLIAAMPIT
jgi:hypothetical protein